MVAPIPPNFTLGAVLLAAGAGSRLGGRPKCLLQLDGAPLIVRQICALLGAGVTSGVVVLGHHAEAIESALKGLQSAEFSLARNARPDDGQGSSVLLGLRALPAHCDGVVIALADQPLINAADIAALTTAFAQRGSAQMVVPTRDGTPGNPVVIDAALRQEWQNQGADWVGKRWRKANPHRVHCLNTDNPNYFLDIDTPHDLERFAQTTGKTLLWPSQDA